MKPQISERALQQTFVSMFRAFYPKFQLILSLSGTNLNGTTAQKAMIIKDWISQGWQKGLPDITICIPNSVTIHLELKKPGSGVQSTEQMEVQARLTKLGHHYYLVDDVSDMFTIIAEHTLLADRKQAFAMFLMELSQPKIIEQFFMFPIGTDTNIVMESIKPYFHLGEL